MGKRSNHKKKANRGGKQSLQAPARLSVYTSEALERVVERAYALAIATGKEQLLVADLKSTYWQARKLAPYQLLGGKITDETPLRQSMGRHHFVAGHYVEMIHRLGFARFMNNTY